LSWPFDATDPHVTADSMLANYGIHEGFSPEQLRLPSVMLATFQGGAYNRLVEATGAQLPIEVPVRPGAALAAAASLLVGTTAGGRAVTVTRLPVGAPATGITLEVAIARGVRTILVCGSAGSLQPTLPLGSTVVVTGAEREDGTSHHYLPAGETVAADSGLSTALDSAARKLGLSPIAGKSWTIDAPFRETTGAILRHQQAGVAVVEMEAAAIFAIAQVRGARAGLIVAVSDELYHAWNPGFHLPVYVEALTRVADALLSTADSLTET
jgi:uridine phosphorylase